MPEWVFAVLRLCATIASSDRSIAGPVPAREGVRVEAVEPDRGHALGPRPGRIASAPSSAIGAAVGGARHRVRH